MSYPVESDFVIVKMGDGATPEVFTIMCGIENISLNQNVQSNDVYRRDCAKPGVLPTRRNRPTGTSWDVTGSGVLNISEITRFKAALGTRKNYRIEFGKRDGTDTGTLLGTYAGPAMLLSFNHNVGDEGTAEVTLAGEDEITWTAA